MNPQLAVHEGPTLINAYFQVATNPGGREWRITKQTFVKLGFLMVKLTSFHTALRADPVV